MSRANVTDGGRKRAELLGGVGALILGIGLGFLFSNFLKPYTIPAILVGLLMHGWGMFDKHRLEGRSQGARVWWVELLYWLCWLALLSLFVYMAASYFRG